VANAAPQDSQRCRIVAALLALIALVFYFLMVEHSVVSLEYSHARRDISGLVARHWEAVVIGAICTAVGAAITIFVQSFLK